MSPLKKITCVLIASSFLALALMVSYLQMSLQDTAIKQWVESKTSSVVQMANRIDSELAQTQSRLQYLANLPSFKAPPNAALINRQLNGIPREVDTGRRLALDWLLTEQDHGFSVLFVLLPNGDHYISHPFSVQRALKTYNLSHRPYFREASQTRSPVISDTFIGADGVAAVAIDLPIVNGQGKISSHLGGVFHLTDLTRLVEQQVSSNDRETTFLLDRSGTLISQHDDVKTYKTNRFVQSFLARQLTTTKIQNYEVVSKLLPATTGIGKRIMVLLRLSSGWTLGVETDMKSIVAHFTPDIWRTAALAAGLLTVICSLGILFAHRIGLQWQTARSQLELHATERTAELEQSEQQHRRLFENAEISIWNEDLSTVSKELDRFRHDGVTDLRRFLKENEQVALDLVASVKVIQVNEATLTLFNARDEGEMLGSIRKTFGPGSLEIFINELCAIWDKQEVYRSEVVLKTLDGKDFNAIISFRIPKTEAGFGSVPVSIIDITEQKKAELALQESRSTFEAITNQSSEGITLTDPEGNYTFVNPAFCEMMGYAEDELRQMTVFDMKAESQDRLIFEKSKISNEPVPGQVILKRKDGTEFIADIVGKRVEINRKENILGTVRDITERKLAEQEKEALEAQLRQAHKMEAIGTMAGGIAHDFNNLLAIIGGNIEIIQHKCNSERDASINFTHAINAAGRAKDLVAQILAFSRQEKGEFVPVDLSIAIAESLKLLRSTIPSTIEIMSNTGQHPLHISADTTQLQQILINLCANAVYAMDEKGLLKVNLEETVLTPRDIPSFINLPPGKYAKLFISDTGKGIDEETIDKIFDPFFTTKGVGQGTGMGLSVVHGIVEQHGGFVTVDSTPGEGTSFNIYLPTINETETELKSDTIDSLPVGTERILFVDDEENLALSYKELLEMQGYKVTSSTSSTEALEIFRSTPDNFDLIFTDQTMPEMSGCELAVELLKIRPGIPIVLCSGYSAKASDEEAKEIGIREFCLKPMDMKQLTTVVRKVIDEGKHPS